MSGVKCQCRSMQYLCEALGAICLLSGSISASVGSSPSSSEQLGHYLCFRLPSGHSHQRKNPSLPWKHRQHSLPRLGGWQHRVAISWSLILWYRRRKLRGGTRVQFWRRCRHRAESSASPILRLLSLLLPACLHHSTTICTVLFQFRNSSFYSSFYSVLN